MKYLRMIAVIVMGLTCGKAYPVGSVIFAEADITATSGTWNLGSGRICNVRIQVTGTYTLRTFTPSIPISLTACVNDHLAWQDVSEPFITPIPCSALEDINGTIRPFCGYGDLTLNDTAYVQVWRDPETGEIDSSIIDHFRSIEATVFTSLPAGNLRLYYVLDIASWDQVYGSERPCGVSWDGCAISLAPGALSMGYLDSDSIHAYDDDVVTVLNPFDPPPDADPGINFSGYVLPNGEDGKNWLPVPGERIGLKFKTTDGKKYKYAFNIWNISAWQGECMNRPLAPPDTQHIGNGPPLPVSGEQYDFDFWPYTPQSFDLNVRDTLIYEDTWAIFRDDSTGMPAESLRVARRDGKGATSQKIIQAVTTSKHYTFTLWLEARDYAAHCLVTVQLVDAGKSNFLRAQITEFGDTTGTISVPRDDDGFSEYYVNYGDFMADYWEDNAFTAPDIRTVWPFTEYNVGTQLIFADLDPQLWGRGFYGDDMVNWEEYRGFIVSSDSTNPWDSTEHRRLNPRLKTVFVHFRPNIDTLLLDLLPSYIYDLSDSVEVVIVKSLLNDTASVDPEWGRLIEAKRIGNCRQGASMIYPMSYIPTVAPINRNFFAQAVSFWKWDLTDEECRNLAERPVLGGTVPVGRRTVFPGPPGDEDPGGGQIPRWTDRILINVDLLWPLEYAPFYVLDIEGRFYNDVREAYSKTIAHEWGHSVGLIHPDTSDQDLMLGIMYNTNIVPSTGEIQTPPGVFLLPDRVSFTVKEANP